MPALLAFGAALALYVRTAAPGLTWAHDGADGGDLLAAALTAGVPHPTGYPTYQLLLRAALGTGLGEPARIGNMLSALCAAVAVGLLTDLARRSLTTMPFGGWAALGAGLIWATSPALWGQATITEVYALNALVVAGVLWLVGVGWGMRVPVAFVLGLGLGNHLTAALLVPGILLLGAGRGQRHAGVFGSVAAFRRSGAFWRLILPGLLGLAVYAYLPWAASRGPAVNWGGAADPPAFAWLVSGTIYRPLVFGLPWAALPGRLAAWAVQLGQQFAGGPWGMLVAAAGLWRLQGFDPRWWRATAVIAAAYTIYAIGYNTPDSFVYLIPAWGVASLWFAHGVAWIGEQIGARSGGRWAAVAMIVGALLLPAAAVVQHWPQMDLSQERQAQAFLDEVLTTAAPGALILVGDDGPTFALWYARYGLGRRPDLTPVNVHLYGQTWYWAALRKQHPALGELVNDGKEPDWEQFLAQTSRRWPLYRAGAVGDLDLPFREEPLGALVRLRP